MTLAARAFAPAPPTALDAWLERHPRRVAAALVLGAAFVRLLLCLQIAAGPLASLHALVPDSDNRFFHEWGRRVAGGDLVQREPFHPMARWMSTVAGEVVAADPGLPARLGIPAGQDRAAVERRLWDRWLGDATFFQEPAYAYLVGLTYALAGPNPWNVFGWQLALGVVGVLLVHRLARRLFSESAALAAAALAILAPVPLLYEVALLRDALVAVVTLAVALLLAWAPGGGRGRWVILGLAFGAGALLKQSFLFFPPLLAAWRLATVRTPWRERLAATGCVAAGMALALLPAAVRNLLVGVPPLALNGSAAGMLAIFHTSGSSPYDLTVPREYVRVMLATGGHPLASLAAAARTHADAWSFVALELRKLAYAWHGFESPNNVDYYLFRQGAPVLAALPITFVVLVPLAGVGVASRRAFRAAWPLLVAIAASLPTLVLAAALSRYRSAITAALLPLAGAGVVRLAAWITARDWRRLGAAAAGAALYLAWATGSPPGREPAARAHRYARTGVEWIGLGQPVLAALNLRESLRLVPDAPKVEARLGQALLALGDAEAALGHVEAAGRSFDSAALRELRAEVLAALGRREEALAAARAALEAEPGRPGARELLDRLERGALRPAGTGARP